MLHVADVINSVFSFACVHSSAAFSFVSEATRKSPPPPCPHAVLPDVAGWWKVVMR
jgi:hypothetical protein